MCEICLGRACHRPPVPRPGTVSRPCRAFRSLRSAPHLWRGFCGIRSLPSACRRRVAPLMVQFPPFAGGEVTPRGGDAPTHTIGPTRSEQFRMQFDWVNFQSCPQTLQFQQYGCAVRHSVGGIACDIRGKLAGRESCAATHSTAGSTATGAAGSAAGSAASDVPVAWHGEYRRRKRPTQAPPRQIKGPRTGTR